MKTYVLWNPEKIHDAEWGGKMVDSGRSYQDLCRLETATNCSFSSNVRTDDIEQLLACFENETNVTMCYHELCEDAPSENDIRFETFGANGSGSMVVIEDVGLSSTDPEVIEKLRIINAVKNGVADIYHSELDQDVWMRFQGDIINFNEILEVCDENKGISFTDAVQILRRPTPLMTAQFEFGPTDSVTLETVRNAEVPYTITVKYGNKTELKRVDSDTKATAAFNEGIQKVILHNS